jgi:hypothetical protein
MANPIFMQGLQTMAVATIYCIWRAYRDVMDQHKADLREKVAYMLWVAANEAA